MAARLARRGNSRVRGLLPYTVYNIVLTLTPCRSGEGTIIKLMLEALGVIEEDGQILSKLIYRNQNQHRNTKIFSHLKTLSKEIRRHYM